MVVPANWFLEWFDSPYYHQLYFEHNKAEAAAFIDRLLETLRPMPGSSMLDIACGRGRHSRTLADKGFDVTGIDIAPNSIDYARQFENENLHFYRHDMRLPFRVNYYDYAFNFFTSFGYFKTDREHYNAIRTIAHALKKKGILVLDYLNIHYAEDHLVHQSEKQIDGVTYYITKWFDETHFYKKIQIEDEAKEAPLVFIEKVAKFTLGDFNEMFSYYGLQIQDVFGDYRLQPYDVKKSPRLILFASREI
jgi:SAM-dependent methyltransferase